MHQLIAQRIVYSILDFTPDENFEMDVSIFEDTCSVNHTDDSDESDDFHSTTGVTRSGKSRKIYPPTLHLMDNYMSSIQTNLIFVLQSSLPLRLTSTQAPILTLGTD
jgi:hypothetical protein